jgi:hypothetical protein
VGFDGYVAETSLLLRQEAASLGGRSPAFRDMFSDISSLEDVTTAFYGNARNGLPSDAALHPRKRKSGLLFYREF